MSNNKRRSKFTVGVTLVTVLLSWAGVAYANTTTTICDQNSPAKYWCSRVQYTSRTGGWTITDREYKGAIDGGAQKWQLYWVKDWQWNGSSWDYLGGWGSQPWHTNVNFDGWWTISTDRDVSTQSAVTGQHHYQEYTPDAGWYYWCSEKWEHYLSDGHSNRVYTSCIAP